MADDHVTQGRRNLAGRRNKARWGCGCTRRFRLTSENRVRAMFTWWLTNCYLACFLLLYSLFDSQHDDCGDTRVGAVQMVVRSQCTFAYTVRARCPLVHECTRYKNRMHGCMVQEMFMTL